MSKSKTLTPGSIGRLFRDGHAIEGIVNIPASGPFTLRHLAPGNYTVRDETGGEFSFVVSAYQEETVVKGWRGQPGQGVEPGGSHVQSFGGERDTAPYDPLRTPRFPNVGPTHPAPADGEDDRPGKGPRPANVVEEVPHGAPGAASITDTPEAAAERAEQAA